MKHSMPIDARLHRIVPKRTAELCNICSGHLPYYVLCNSQEHATAAAKGISRTLARLKRNGRISKLMVVRQSKQVIRICNRGSFAEQIHHRANVCTEKVLNDIVRTPSTEILETEELLGRLVEDSDTPISYSD